MRSPTWLTHAAQIVPEADEAAWVAALGAMLENPGLRHVNRERGLARARDVYSWPHVARQYLDFFRELRERPAASAGRYFSGRPEVDRFGQASYDKIVYISLN